MNEKIQQHLWILGTEICVTAYVETTYITKAWNLCHLGCHFVYIIMYT